MAKRSVNVLYEDCFYNPKNFEDEEKEELCASSNLITMQGNIGDYE
jgi:hypothetical protein